MPITLITGEDTYRVERAVKAARESAIDPIMGTLGQTRLTNPSLADVLEALGTVTLSLSFGTAGAALPLVEIHGGWWLEKAAQSKTDEAGLVQLQDTLLDASERKTILMVSEKANGRLKFVKWLTGNKQVKALAFDIPPPWKAEEVAALLVSEAREAGHFLNHSAARLLVDSYGHALLPLMSEVAKLATYTGDKPIEVSHVQTLCNSGERVQVLLERWVAGSEPVDRRMHHLADILLRQHPLQVMAAAHGYLENAHQLRHGSEVHRHSAEELARQTGKNAYKIKKDLEGLARVPLGRLQALRRRALDAETALKTGTLDAQLALEMLVCQ